MYHLKYVQKLPLSLEDSWKFFSSPDNLKILTPEHLSFEIKNEQIFSSMYAGQIIVYTIRPVLNLPIEWVTEITHIQEHHYFIDEQRFGPYKFWHHEHRFNPLPNGVEMIDTICYKMPLGLIGQALHRFKIKQDLKAIFLYRQIKLEKIFGPYPKE